LTESTGINGLSHVKDYFVFHRIKAQPTVIRKPYEVLLPKLEAHAAITAILSDMDAEIAALEAKLAKARQIKQRMMQELLTGRIRVV